ncbi:MAG: hypothetical protein PHF17_02095 [Arcobacteraceae bacterium]|jgi:anaerobic C4-dicarboxylate transporter|nr:hypothetical protein [Arcobacteraceae bacterium]
MFLLIPVAVIFLLFVYLHMHDDLSTLLEIIVYSLMVGISYISFVLYKKVKNDFKQQEINAISIEIKALQSKISHSKDEKTILFYKQKIKNLENEIEEKLKR